MAGRVKEMVKMYIVYTFYRGESTETNKFWVVNKVVKPPVIVVYDEGKPVARYEGIQDTTRILGGVKTKREQKKWYPDWLKLW
jgi:hypothetical protein